MLQAVYFDHDGTLAQTMERQFGWFDFYSKKNSKKFDFDLKSFIAFYNSELEKNGGVQNVYDSLNLPCDMSDKNHPVWPAYEEYKKVTPAPLYDGIKEAVKEIWEAGALSTNPNNNRRIRLGINTTNTWKSVSKDLSDGDILKYFDSFVTREVLDKYHGAGNGDAITKPSKISLALMLGLTDSIGKHVIYIGDTLNDLAASQKVMRLNPSYPETLITVGAVWGYEGKDTLEKGVDIPGEGTTHFNYIANKPSDLVGIIKKYLK